MNLPSYSNYRSSVSIYRPIRRIFSSFNHGCNLRKNQWPKQWRRRLLLLLLVNSRLVFLFTAACSSLCILQVSSSSSSSYSNTVTQSIFYIFYLSVKIWRCFVTCILLFICCYLFFVNLTHIWYFIPLQRPRVDGFHWCSCLA